MWEITIALAIIIYVASVIVFINELVKEANGWEDTLWSKWSILFFGLASIIPLLNTVVAIKAYKFRKKEERLE